MTFVRAAERPVVTGQGLVTAEASVIHAGRRTATAEARVLDEDRRLSAHATTTCLLDRRHVQES